MTRILSIVAGVILPPIGVVVFGVGAQQSLNESFRYIRDSQPGFGWVVMLLGALIVAAGVGSAFWSGIGVAVAGGVGVLIGFIQFAFPISMGSFNFGSWLVFLLGDALPHPASQALLTVVYLGGPLTVGSLLLGAGVGLWARRRAAGQSTLWQIVGVLAVVIGIPVALAGQSLLVYSLRTARIDPISTVVLLVAAVLLATAAYSSRGGGLALAISGAVVAALGLVVAMVPTLLVGPSAIVSASQEVVYLTTQGYPLLFGLLLLATGVVSLLLGRNRADAVPAPAV